MQLPLQEQIKAAIFAAMIAILAQIVIPLGVVPISLQTFAVGLTVTILGRKTGFWALLIYLLLGLIGLPVFAGGKSGIGVLFGPTGGYLIGFLVAAFVIGTLIQHLPFNYFGVTLANLVGFILSLFFGTVWLKFAAGLPWPAAITGGFLSFVFPEIIKAIAAGVLGVLILRHLPKRFISFSK